jgi:uncharacterized membrane protein YgcG
MLTTAADSDGLLRCKLAVAVWAAETDRTQADLRAFPDTTRAAAMAAIGVVDAWAPAVQDGLLVPTFKLCRQAAWALDPGHSFGLLTAERLAGGASTSSRDQLAAMLPVAEFQNVERALLATGRTFRDVTWAGGSWSLAEPGSRSGGAASTVGTGGGGAPSSAFSFGSSAFSSVSHQGGETARREVVRAMEAHYEKIRFDIYAETAHMRNRSKMHAADSRKRERSFPGAPDDPDGADVLPLCMFPWNQKLDVSESHSLSMIGRFLRIALVFFVEGFPDPMLRLLAHTTADEQTRMYEAFCSTARAEDYSATLCSVTGMLTYAGTRMRLIVQDSKLRAQTYPDSVLFAHVAQLRAEQERAVERLADEVLKRVTSVTKDVPLGCKPACTVGMWDEFFGGWMPATYSASYCEDPSERWSGIKSRGQVAPSARSGGSGGAVHNDGRGQRGGSPPGSGGAAGGGGGSAGKTGGTPPGGSSGPPPQEFRRTIPCAIDVVGDTLGVVSNRKCARCKPPGRFHNSSDCPLGGHSRLARACPVSTPTGLGTRLRGAGRRSPSELATFGCVP